MPRQHKARASSQSVMPKHGSHLFLSLVPTWEMKHQNCHLDPRRSSPKLAAIVI
jgi:hypothetical protein